MALAAFGINHNTATVALREQVAFTPDQLPDALHALHALKNIRGCVILSTCNRTEIFADLIDEDIEPLIAFLGSIKQIDLAVLRRHAYYCFNNEALARMIRVGSGLDSMVLGEPQILGQLKTAVAIADEHHCLGGLLSPALQHTFSYAKRIRSQTGVGENPVSVAYAAITLASHIFSDLSQTRVLLIGAGETIDLVARHLVDNGISNLYVAGRTLSRAQKLAGKYKAKAMLLADIEDTLPAVDIVVSSTASQLPLIGKGLIERVMTKRRHKPLFMVDIAVPRDIEPEVGQLTDVYLYTVDDLSDVIAENVKSRQQEVKKAEIIIHDAISHFDKVQKAQQIAPSIKAFREQVDAERERTLAEALKALKKGEEPEQVLTNMARLLANRLAHKPSRNIKEAVLQNDKDALAQFNTLFDLSLRDNNKT